MTFEDWPKKEKENEPWLGILVLLGFYLVLAGFAIFGWAAQ